MAAYFAAVILCMGIILSFSKQSSDLFNLPFYDKLFNSFLPDLAWNEIQKSHLVQSNQIKKKHEVLRLVWNHRYIWKIKCQNQIVCFISLTEWMNEKKIHFNAITDFDYKSNIISKRFCTRAYVYIEEKPNNSFKYAIKANDNTWIIITKQIWFDCILRNMEIYYEIGVYIYLF